MKEKEKSGGEVEQTWADTGPNLLIKLRSSEAAPEGGQLLADTRVTRMGVWLLLQPLGPRV